MAAIYSDEEISALLRERKWLGRDWRTQMKFREKRGQVERQLELSGADGTTFRLIVRRNESDPTDFSAILAVDDQRLDRLFILRRCDGPSHRHRNAIEGNSFRDFHIHEATERYQLGGFREDGFARPTNRYGDADGALRCLFTDAHFDLPTNEPTQL